MFFPVYLVVPAIFISYLLTISPTILWRDTPEFVNVAFTLSIAHPAGFPTYSLLLKPLTFLPIGSIAFKTNLASAIFSLLSVVLLSATLRLFIRRLYPSAPSADIQTSSIVASLLFAVGPIVWHNATLAEVYTLNTLFLAAVIYLMLRWLDGFDPRWLYLSAFLYGLSAGNHAAVALFLPGLLAVYFFNRQERNSCEWIRAVFFFLLGLSVYLYLPVRSLANPPYDWADPQILKNFLYQITDQKDFGPGGVLSESKATSTPLVLIINHLSLIARQFSPVGIVLILLGVTSALRGEKGLSLLLLWILFSNHTFFWGWTSGDAFLPSYLALAFFLGVGTCILLGISRQWSQVSASRVRELVGIGLSGLIVAHILFTYPKVNKRDYYLPSDFFRPVFRTLDPNSVFLTEIQWSHFKYLQDIGRLREDISLLSLSEITQPSSFHTITSERHPNLVIPQPDQVTDNSRYFLAGLISENDRAGHAIFVELTRRLKQYVDFPILPHQDFIFRVSMDRRGLPADQIALYARQIEEKLSGILAVRQATYDPDIHLYLYHYIDTLAHYLDQRHYYKGAVGLLGLYLRAFGPEGTKSIGDKKVSIIYNNIAFSELRLGETSNGLRSLELAIRYDPKNPHPYLNLALWSLEKAPGRFGEILERARKNGLNPKIICATLSDDLLKEGQTNLLKKTQALCKKKLKETADP